MRSGLVLLLSAAGMAAAASAEQPSGLERVRFQDVVPVQGASRAQIYDAASQWFEATFHGPKDELVRNPLAGTLVGTGHEKYAPAVADGSCNFWIHYQVLVGAREGRFYYSIGGFSVDGDPICRIRSFQIPMNLGLAPMAERPTLNLSMRPPPTREEDERQIQRDLEKRAADLMDSLGRSLRGKLSTAAAGKPSAKAAAAPRRS